MYNKALDVFKAVAENSSFSKAAKQLYISHTAVIKQINQLENHLGVRLFERTHRGILITPAGQQLYKETLHMMKESEEAIHRVQDAYLASPQTLRIGSSLLYPCYDFMEIWEHVNDSCPQFKLEIVPFYDDENRIKHLKDDFDFLISPYNNVYEENELLFFHIGYYQFCFTMPRNHRLAKNKTIDFKDLEGETLMIMRKGTSPINDEIREEIEKNYPQIKLQDISPQYNLDTFNHCAQNNAILLSLSCWKKVHPGLVSVDLNNKYLMPYGIIIDKQSSNRLKKFAKILQSNIMH